MPRTSGPKKRKKHTGLLITILAIFCILGMELAVCRVVSPSLFQRVTAPIQAAVHAVTTTVASFTQNVSLWVQNTLPEKKEAVNQEASEPSIQTDLPPEDTSITTFAQQNGQEILTGGTIPLIYYNQGESPWKDKPYGSDPIRGYGCGPTSMAMVVSSLTGQVIDPAKMAAWAAQEGYCAPGSGSYHSLVLGTAESYNLHAWSWRDFGCNQLLQGLSAGNVFVALMGRGHFTNSGHFIVLRGITMDGRILVADPNSRARSLIAWDPQLILNELSSSTGNGGPLWCFSANP